MILVVQEGCTTVTSASTLPSNIRDFQMSLVHLWDCYNNIKPAEWAEVEKISLNINTAILFLKLKDGTCYKLPYYGDTKETLVISYKNTMLYLLEQMGKMEGADE